MVTAALLTSSATSGGFRVGGDGGMHAPHQPQLNDFSRKITLNFGEDLFFVFCFWRPPDFGQKKALNLRFRPKIQSQNR